MGPERNRRIVIAVIVSVLYLLSSWIEDDDDPHTTDHHTTDHNVKSSVKFSTRRLGKSLGDLEKGSEKTKNNNRDDETKYQEDYGDFLNEDDDDDEAPSSYVEAFKAKSDIYFRTSAFHFDLHACLPKFICEIHAHHVSNDLTELEKDIIGLFRNYVVLEGPGSPVYTYQVAAHMGQLATGLEPSPCQDLYPTCPLSRPQLLDILRNVKSSRRMF